MSMRAAAPSPRRPGPEHCRSKHRVRAGLVGRLAVVAESSSGSQRSRIRIRTTRASAVPSSGFGMRTSVTSVGASIRPKSLEPIVRSPIVNGSPGTAVPLAAPTSRTSTPLDPVALRSTGRMW